MKNALAICSKLFPAIIAVTAVACGGETTGESDVLASAEAITGGTLVTTNGVPYSSVILLANICTATKVGNRRFLTAGHCVPNIVAGSVIPISNALDGSNPINVTVANVFVHPSVENVVLNPNTNPAVEGHMTYDAALVDITTDTPTITTQPVNTIAFSDGFSGNDVGFGCDNSDSTHQGKKQTGVFTAMTLAALKASTGQTAAYSLDVYTHDAIFDSALAGRQICPGDSGGPTFRNSTNAVTGINSVLAGPLSYVVRAGNIRRWIAQPQKNVFTNGSGGFLLNALTAKCAGSGGNASGFSAFCNAPNQETDSEFWTLQAQSNGYFSFVNGSTGLCLDLVRGVIRFGSGLESRTCNGADTQSWKFTQVTPVNSPAYFRIESKVVVSATVACIDDPFDANNQPLSLQQCVDKPSQRWIFTE